MKKAFIVAAGAALALSLVGCSSQEAGTGTGSESSQAQNESVEASVQIEDYAEIPEVVEFVSGTTMGGMGDGLDAYISGDFNSVASLVQPSIDTCDAVISLSDESFEGSVAQVHDYMVEAAMFFKMAASDLVYASAAQLAGDPYSANDYFSSYTSNLESATQALDKASACISAG